MRLVSNGKAPAKAILKARIIHNVKANWRFTTADARVKLECLYPAL